MMNRSSEAKVSLSPQKLSGALGLVIVPDSATIERAYALANEIMPQGAEFTLSHGSIPYLTLYHGKLEGLPKDFVQGTLGALRADLVGKKFELKSIVAFGGNFIFWEELPFGYLKTASYIDVLKGCCWSECSNS